MSGSESIFRVKLFVVPLAESTHIESRSLCVRTQRLRDSIWVDSASGTTNSFTLNIDSDPLIPPHSERAVSVTVPAPAPGPWRVYAWCSKEYPAHWSKALRRLADAYVLKLGVVEV